MAFILVVSLTAFSAFATFAALVFYDYRTRKPKKKVRFSECVMVKN